ncbi:MAG: hypothetical protein EBZ52_08585 [Actinobacteria bacterium]|nr:hypothetical protein [Actinomycetota bacterium]
MKINHKNNRNFVGKTVDDKSKPESIDSCRTRHAVFSECPHCGSALHAEHAHFKCSGCGWRDSCCD